MRIRRVWKAGLLLAVGAAGGGAALAVASVPDSNGVIHACVQVTTVGGVVVPDPNRAAPNVWIIDPSAGQHCVTPDGTVTVQTALSWNALGRRGPAGPPGRSVTVAGGQTLTLSGGDVVTVGSSTGVTVTTPTLTSRSQPIGIVDFGGGVKVPLYSYSVAGKGGSTGAGGGGVALQDFNFTRYVDKSSVILSKYCVHGTHIPTVNVHLLKPEKKGSKPKEYLEIKLTDVSVSSYQQTKGGTKPTESVSLNFSKIKYDYKQQSGSGGP